MLAAIHYLSPFNFRSYFLPENKQKLPFDHLQTLHDLAEALTTADQTLAQWIDSKKQIKCFVEQRKEELVEVDAFLETLMKWGIERDSQKTLAFLVDIIELETLRDVARFKSKDFKIPFEDVFEWVEEREHLYPKPVNHHLFNHAFKEWRKCRPLVLYFIPNLINIFLGAFNFLDIRKRYTTLWEKHLLLEIVYKFFVIPYCLIQMLKPILVISAKVYIVAALILLTGGVLAACYQRWFRPLPDEIIYCENLDKQLELEILEPKVGQTQEIEQLVTALLAGQNVVLVGRSGEGKTALVHHFIQLKREKKLTEHLQKLTNYEVDCGLMISNVSFGHSELINQIKEQIAGYEEDILLFFDEFYQITINKAAFQAFKKRFLEDKPHPKFVATVTPEQWEEIKKLDVSFERRVTPIIIEPASDEQIHLILDELIPRLAQKIPVTEEAKKKIIELSKSADYLPEIGRAAKAIKILTAAIGKCEVAYSPYYVSKELREVKQEKKSLKMKAIQHIKADEETLLKIRQVRQKSQLIKQELKENKKKIQQIKVYRDRLSTMSNKYYQLTHKLAKARNLAEKVPQKKLTQEMQKMYLLYEFYGIDVMKNLLQNELNAMQPKMQVQIDTELILSVFNNLKR